MPAIQQCPKCGSPLRPCKCEREAKEGKVKRWNSTVPVRKKPKRRGRRKTKAESDAEWARKYHSPERREWVGRLPCCACGKKPTPRWPSENHHTWTEGTGRKGPYRAIVPLCRPCHRRHHKVGKLSMLQAAVRERAGLWVGSRATGHNAHLRQEDWRSFDQWEDAAAYVQALWLRYAAL